MNCKAKMIVALLVALSLVPAVGCSGKKRSAPAPAAAQKQAAAPAAETLQPEGPKVEKEIYDYDQRGRRDPFTSLILPEKEKSAKKKKGKPIESFELDEIRLSAITWDKKKYQALIILPDGKSFTIRQGMTIGANAGKVIEISKNRVLIREEYKDYKGELKTKDTILKLRKEGDE